MPKQYLFFNWLILIGVGLILNFSQLKKPVQGRHSWANADHYAIALNFMENGFNFFKPETYCVNPQFSPKQLHQKEFWQHPQKDLQGVTAIDFPIHHYLIAILMKLSGIQGTYVFRGYMFLLSLVGLFFLGKTTFFYTKSFKWVLFVQLFVMLSPTYTFYSVAFLPSAAALSILFIASFYVANYLETNFSKYLIVSISILTLSALTRFPFIIYLIAFLFFYLYKLLLFKDLNFKNTLMVMLGIGIVMMCFFYNSSYLFSKYGSNFLNHPMYPSSFNEGIQVLKITFFHEIWRYFTPIHYSVIIYFIVQLCKTKIKFSFKENKLAYLFIATLGVLIYMILMLKQFKAHDYYALDTFFPILVFWMIGVYLVLPQSFFDPLVFGVMLVSALILNKVVFKYGYEARSDDDLEITRQNFLDADLILANLQIPSSSKILLIDAKSPNLAFIGLKRKGFVVMQTKTEIIQKAMTWEYDYIITQNFTFKEKVLANYPSFSDETVVFFSNDKFTIHTKRNF